MKFKETKVVNIKRIFAIIFLILLSIGIGVLITCFGKGHSFVEDKTAFISVIITLFGLGMTSAIFIAQTLDTINFDEKKAEKAYKLKISLTKSLGLAAILILVSIVLEFVCSAIPVVEENSKNNFLQIISFVLNSGIYALFSYVIILQVDITASFLQIMRLRANKK